jgi:hypothetical protein
LTTHKKQALIATVTYGDRARQLENGALKSYLTHNTSLIIVANGVSDQYKNYLQHLNKSDDIKVIFSNNNEGSAGGFHKLISECTNLMFEYCILLDDDNELIGDIHNYVLRREASFIPRKGRKYIDQALKGIDPTPYLAAENSFLGFDVKRIILKKISVVSQNKFELEQFNFPWSPYGGLILSKHVIECGILPMKELFLYCDDTIYTNQLSKKFGLYLDTELEIIDVEESWNVSTNGNVISRILVAQEQWRVFYSVRNQIYFDTQRFDSRVMFYFNVFGFISAFIVLGLIPAIFNRQKYKNVKVFFKALKDGFSGNLDNKGFKI